MRNRRQRKRNKFRLFFLLLILCAVAAFSIWEIPRILPNFNPQKTELKEDWDIADFFTKNDFLSKKVDQWYDEISPDQRVAQLIMPAIEKVSDLAKISRLIEKDKIAGFMVLNSDITSENISNLKNSRKNSLVPLFVSIDAEPSLIKYRIPKLGEVPATNELQTPADIQKYGQKIANYLNEFGVNINFAPVYDFGDNDSVIGDRAFADNALEAGIRGNLFAQSQLDRNIFPTAKHFPGHGQVLGDTHKSLQTISGEFQELESFSAAIKSNIPLIMVGHLAVENNEKYNTDGNPATLSSEIMQNLLREKMGFRGIIITDAMNMGAISNIENRGLESLVAGADIILMPESSEILHEQIVAEISRDFEFAKEVETKVKRVLRMKVLWKLMRIE